MLGFHHTCRSSVYVFKGLRSDCSISGGSARLAKGHIFIFGEEAIDGLATFRWGKLGGGRERRGGGRKGGGGGFEWGIRNMIADLGNTVCTQRMVEEV